MELRVEAAVRVLSQTGVPGSVQRVSEVVSDRHALDRCAEHLRDARDSIGSSSKSAMKSFAL